MDQVCFICQLEIDINSLKRCKPMSCCEAILHRHCHHEMLTRVLACRNCLTLICLKREWAKVLTNPIMSLINILLASSFLATNSTTKKHSVKSMKSSCESTCCVEWIDFYQPLRGHAEICGGYFKNVQTGITHYRRTGVVPFQSWSSLPTPLLLSSQCIPYRPIVGSFWTPR